MSRIASIALIISLTLLASCSQQTASSSSAPAAPKKEVPAFSADSAYRFIETQLAFGARVPGSPAQQQCADWLVAQLKQYGATVKVQHGTVVAYNGTELPAINIVGSYNPSAKSRVLIVSHWDCRPMADHDPDASKRNQPVPSANDGASGVGVILELARQASLKQPAVGIDLFLTDAEDYGAPEDWSGEHTEEQWGLGTQMWCDNPHTSGYTATYGILLDMVGAEGATFHQELYSKYFAPDIVRHVWDTAKRLGYGKYFKTSEGGAITDDHVFINRIRRIPTIDIIDTRPQDDSSFFPYWHTTDDTLDKLSLETLQAVGTVLMHLIY